MQLKWTETGIDYRFTNFRKEMRVMRSWKRHFRIFIATIKNWNVSFKHNRRGAI